MTPARKRYHPPTGFPEDIMGSFSSSHDEVRLIDAHAFERHLVAAIRYANKTDFATEVLACVLPVLANEPTRDPGGKP